MLHSFQLLSVISLLNLFHQIYIENKALAFILLSHKKWNSDTTKNNYSALVIDFSKQNPQLSIFPTFLLLGVHIYIPT